MVTKTVTMVNPQGFHMRPAGMFAQEMAKFQSSLTIRANGKAVDGKSVMHLMAAALKCGTQLTLECDGPDEQAMLDAAAQLISSGLGE